MSYSNSYINRTDLSNGVIEDSLPRSLRRLEESLAGVWHEFDVIVVSGLSGIIPGAILAHKHGKQLVVIRKDDDETHGVRTEGAEYFKPGTPYIVLDDFVSSGRTMARIINKMEELDYGLPKYVVLYRGTWWTSGVECGYTEKRVIDAHHVAHGLYTLFIKKEKAA